MPADLIDTNLDRLLNYYPLAYDESTDGQFAAITEEQDWPIMPLQTNLVVATALHLWRMKLAQKQYTRDIFKKQGVKPIPVDKELILASVIDLKRTLSI